MVVFIEHPRVLTPAAAISQRPRINLPSVDPARDLPLRKHCDRKPPNCQAIDLNSRFTSHNSLGVAPARRVFPEFLYPEIVTDFTQSDPWPGEAKMRNVTS